MGLRRADLGGPADKKLTHVRVHRQQKHSYTRPCTPSAKTLLHTSVYSVRKNTPTHVRVQRQQTHVRVQRQQKRSYTRVRFVKERETIGRLLWVWAGRNIFCFSGPDISSLQQWSMQ